MVCIPDYCGTKSFTWYLIRVTGFSVLQSFRGFESSRVARREGQRGGGGRDCLREQRTERDYTTG